MTLVLNTLFTVGVEVKGSDYTYQIYNLSDDVVYSEILGSAWSSSHLTLERIGHHLVTQYLEKSAQYLMYGCALSHKGSTELKWWYEKEARDTTIEFTQQLGRPELWGTMSFEFLIHKEDTRPVYVETMAVLQYSALISGREI